MERDGRARVAVKKNKKRQGKGKGQGGDGDGDGSGNGIKKGFSDEQVRMLETMFETETKPEPRKKVELARELGLQPRQVAIWFQNRRARWKSKQLEREYRALKCEYDKLSADYELLKKEKQGLRSELQRITDMLRSAGDQSDAGEDGNAGTFSGDGANCDTKYIGGHDCFDREAMLCPQMDDETIENSVEEMCDLLNVGGNKDDGGSLTEIPEKWCGLGPSEMSAAVQWWNFCT
ncbi:hypothetical protein MLD38_030453 [Melastoma candidum]|uniref:Uncharacterized protein n=1 Tax=Melastoma candidum TaxID=119954 RepID=A0ACB9MLV6_9MYRT|nr:hypothetical protein MLD38_030453 [Melastoma candidum]